MSVFRINKSKNYTVMSNYHLRDKKLSFKAKGMLSYMLSLPDDWDYSLQGLSKASKDNITSIKSTIEELKTTQYLKITKERDKMGRFTYIYNIYEKSEPGIDFPPLENPSMEKPETENPIQLNTNNKILKKEKKKEKKLQNTNYEQREYTEEDFKKFYANK